MKPRVIIIKQSIVLRKREKYEFFRLIFFKLKTNNFQCGSFSDKLKQHNFVAEVLPISPEHNTNQLPTKETRKCVSQITKFYDYTD